MPHFEYLSGDAINDRVMGELVPSARDSLLIATATLKAMRVVKSDGTAESIVHLLERLSGRGVTVRVLHSGIPSGPFREELKTVKPGAFHMRRCPRTHFKAVVVDGTHVYLGSANLTGAGLGAKSEGRRNFEIGLVTDDAAMVDAVADLFESIWSGAQCQSCDRTDFCPVPLEEPFDE